MKRKIGVADRIAKISQSWELHAPETKFAGMTLAEFKTAAAPSLEKREIIANWRNQVRGALLDRGVADQATRQLIKRVVYSVLADGQFGSNSGLYRSMDYVPEIERATGMVRKAVDPAAAAASAPAPTA